MRSVSVHLHSCSLRHHFSWEPGFDIFAFIALARAQGFDGVNISADGPGFRHLGGTDSGHFTSVRAALLDHDLSVELETSDTRPQHLHLLLEVAASLGADRLRTCSRHRGEPQEMIDRTVDDLSIASDRADVTGVQIALQSQQDFLSPELLEIVQRVDSEHVRILFDYGSAQLLGEDPTSALETVMPALHAVHVKDQTLITRDAEMLVQGETTGAGMLPLQDITRRVFEAGVQRLCFESAWGELTPLAQRTTRLPDTPCFAVHQNRPAVDGAALQPAHALAGERKAVERGWSWFNSMLSAAVDAPSLAQQGRGRARRN